MDNQLGVRRIGLWLGLGSWLVMTGCSATSSEDSTSRAAAAGARAGLASTSAPGGAAVGGSSTTGSTSAAAGSGASSQSIPAATGGATTPIPTQDSCTAPGTVRPEGCPCKTGDTAACWTGSLADRNYGACHDGLQICSGSANNEFASWGPCMGEQHECGTDAGVPPEDETECACIPGAVIQCSEDCSLGIICSLTASKTCQPDGTWGVCREDLGVTLDLPGFQCRNMLHGCFEAPVPGRPGPGQGELYVGDCSKQFKCGHAPPPPPPPPPPVVPN